ncbi:hypothetical protein [Providencia phage PSTCR6]|nr:hypothetical protein [Providencia phage PSTCR6]
MPVLPKTSVSNIILMVLGELVEHPAEFSHNKIVEKANEILDKLIYPGFHWDIHWVDDITIRISIWLITEEGDTINILKQMDYKVRQ